MSMKKTVLGFMSGLLLATTLPLGALADDIDVQESKDANTELIARLEQIKQSDASSTEKGKELVELYSLQVTEQQKMANQVSILRTSLDEKTLELADKESQLTSSENKLKIKNKELESKSNDVAKNEKRLSDIQKELDTIDKNIEKKKELSDTMAKKAQLNANNNSLLNVILDSGSVSESISYMVSLNKLNKANKEFREDLVNEKESAEKLKSEQAQLVSSRKTEEAELKGEKEQLELQKNNLEKERNELKTRVDRLNKEKTEVDTLSETSLAKIQEINQELFKVSDGLSDLYSELDTIKSKLDKEKNKIEIEDIEKLQQKIKEILEKEATVTTMGSLPTAKENETFLKEVGNITEAQKKLVETSQKYLGVPYVWGGTAVNGMDCSGFTQRVYREALGIEITRVTYTQQYQGKEVPLSDIQVGDLIFWGEPTYHVGIYVGNGQYIHAPQPGDVIKYSSWAISDASHIRRIIK